MTDESDSSTATPSKWPRLQFNLLSLLLFLALCAVSLALYIERTKGNPNWAVGRWESQLAWQDKADLLATEKLHLMEGGACRCSTAQKAVKAKDYVDYHKISSGYARHGNWEYDSRSKRLTVSVEILGTPAAPKTNPTNTKTEWVYLVLYHDAQHMLVEFVEPKNHKFAKLRMLFVKSNVAW